MSKQVPAVAVLCALLAACQAPGEVSRDRCIADGLQDLARWRWIEPRLTAGFARQACRKILPKGHVVEMTLCPSPHQPPRTVSMTLEGCDWATRQQVEALRTLISFPDRTEEAVEMLETLAARTPSEARLLSDLAAAYLVRAQRTDRASDLLRSFQTAQRAVALAGHPPEAQFNHALVHEALELPSTTDSWEAFLSRDKCSGWAVEARERLKNLERKTALAAATRWLLNRERLAAAVRANDRPAIGQLIAPFPAAARIHLEEEVLPAWARALSQGRQEEARRHLTLARAVATELARLTGDFHLADAIGVVTRASSTREEAARLHALVDGHLAFGDARRFESAQNWERAESHYHQASRSFARAGSPLRSGADLGLAIALFQKPDLSQVLARLQPIEKEARSRHYGHLLGRALWIRALCLSFLGRPLEARADYDEAIAKFAAMGDGENAANVRVRKAGLFRVLGESELAWQEIFQALPDVSRIVDLESRHHLLGETAVTAVALGYPEIALLYQNQAVEMIQTAMRSASLEERDEKVTGLLVHLAISLRARAAIEVLLGRDREALRDLDEAIRLGEEPLDANIRRRLQAGMLEVRGDAEVAANPRRAIASWSDALQLSPAGEHRIFLASLHFRIARAQRRLGRSTEALKHLQAGTEELRIEERTILEGRQRGQAEDLWTACFSRFQEGYRLLIRLLLEERREAAAFAVAEKARAYEPLDLVLRSPFAPEAFRRLAATGRALELPQVQEHLPPDTFLVEYGVLEDRLLTWVVSRDGTHLLTQRVSREALAQWTGSLLASANGRNVEAFEARLTAPFPDIVSEPLSLIRKALAGRTGKGLVVFIPDGPLHGLPFAALRDRATGRHVVEDFPVAIAPSATLYVYARLRDAEIPPAAAPSALLLGDPAFRSPLARTLAPLPEAATEVRRISPLYPGAEVLTGEEATADRLLFRAGESTVVHFAGHAVVNSRFPFRSFLLLAPARDLPGELYAEELLRRLQLRKTRLVVLSACSSAGGHPIGPEGLAALVRPLFAAGSPAVVGSLWKVGSKPTEELLVRFHEHYTGGEDAARALRQAQLDLRSGPILFWAPFQVVGHTDPPFSLNHKRRDVP